MAGFHLLYHGQGMEKGCGALDGEDTFTTFQTLRFHTLPRRVKVCDFRINIPADGGRWLISWLICYRLPM